jgi:UDP-glucose 4-epimerase
VIDAVREASGVDFRVEEGPRRAGDPSALVASNRRIKEVLGWRPRHDDLEYIVRTAWRWEQKMQTSGGPQKFDVARDDPPTSRPAGS